MAIPRRAAWMLAFLLSAGCAAGPPAAPPAAEAWDRELPPGLRVHGFGTDAEEDGTPVIPVRVVADEDGSPIAGARIDNWWEADTPGAEPWEDLRQGSWTTDRDGWALLPTEDRAPWYFVEAPGRGPHAEMSFDPEYRLVKGTDFPIEVRDWRDRPVPGATVEAFLGCGHTPTVRTATAGPDGRLVLPCIDPSHETDLWIRTPGLAGRNEAYWGDGPQGLPVVDGIHVLRGDPGPALEGRVLRSDGTPAAGARVGSREAHRGPWTVADSEGRYRLVGAQARSWIVALAPLADPVPEGYLRPGYEFLSVPGAFTTVRLPAGAWLGERDPPVEETGVSIRLVASAGEGITGPVGVLLVREGDGAARADLLDLRDGTAEGTLAVGAGSWTVTAGTMAGPFGKVSRKVEVTKGWSDLSIPLEPNPIWHPRILAPEQDSTTWDARQIAGGAIRITSDEGIVDAVHHLGKDGLPDGGIYVPAAGPFAVEFALEASRSVRVLLDGPPTGPGPNIVLPPGLPARWSDEPEPPKDFPAARLTVLGPDGLPAAGAEVDSVSPRRRIDLDEEGAAECGFDRGERLRIVATGEAADATLPFEARIDGPGPWTLRWPTGAIVVRAVDGEGRPIPGFSVSLGGWDSLDAEEGVVRIRGAGTRPVRLWVGAPGMRVHDLRVVLEEGESREVVVRMHPAR